MMTVLETILKAEEGCKLTVYKDTLGNATIGYGHTDGDNDKSGDELPKTITQEEAEGFLQDDMADAIGDTNDALPWVSGLDENRAAAVYALVFQMGVDGLSKFKKMLSALQASQWQSACDCLLDSLVAKQTPNRIKRLAGVLLTGTLPEYYNS